jgi:hypothetical protein
MIKSKYREREREREREDPVCVCVENLRPIWLASERKWYMSRFLKGKEKSHWSFEKVCRLWRYCTPENVEDWPKHPNIRTLESLRMCLLRGWVRQGGGGGAAIDPTAYKTGPRHAEEHTLAVICSSLLSSVHPSRGLYIYIYIYTDVSFFILFTLTIPEIKYDTMLNR